MFNRFNKKIIIWLVVLTLAGLGAWVGAAEKLVDHTSSLSGRVVSDGLVIPGATVREGDILVKVDTITGPMPAVRATVDGRVREVLVKPGDMVQAGSVVVRIEPVQK